MPGPAEAMLRYGACYAVFNRLQGFLPGTGFAILYNLPIEALSRPDVIRRAHIASTASHVDAFLRRRNPPCHTSCRR